MSDIEFKGKIYDTKKWYITKEGVLTQVTIDRGFGGEELLLCALSTGSTRCISYHLDQFDISLIALPEKVKIVPEKGKVYFVENKYTGGRYYLEYNGSSFFYDNICILTEDANILHEMVKKDG